MMTSTTFPYRPQIPISSDGAPLAVRFLDFFPGQFPYHRLPTKVTPDSSTSSFSSSAPGSILVPSAGVMAALMRPEVCVGLCLFYLASKPVLKSIAKSPWVNPQSTLFVALVTAHNLLLAVFSAVVFVHSWPVVLGHYLDRGWEAVYCDQDGSLWGTAGLGGWATIFYISKYYEFVDTWVLLLKVTRLAMYFHFYNPFVSKGKDGWGILFIIFLTLSNCRASGLFFQNKIKIKNRARNPPFCKCITILVLRCSCGWALPARARGCSLWFC